MKLGFVFPGQGAQFSGMGKDLFENYEAVRKVYKRASDILGEDIAKLTFESLEEELGETKNTQICILVMSLAILEVLQEEGIQAEIAAGLSLGEYAALIYSGMLSFEDGVQIVRTRGKLMQENTPAGNWKMAAIIGLEDEVVEKVCKQAEEYGFVKPVNYNCPMQIVISGEAGAVENAMELATQAGAKRAMELKTSGPFHTEKLEVASQKLKEELDKIEVKNNSNITVIKNRNAKAYTTQDNVKQILAEHITHPVYFGKSVQEMIDLGVDTFVEIGPGKVLAGFIKRVSKDVNVININNVESLQQAITTLKN